jgi:hypothetical protein
VSEELHVHRAADWFESEFQPISRPEWATYVTASDDLVPWADGTIRWTGHPDGTSVALVWQDGRIIVENVDGPTRVRLALVAAAFEGLLQGDDCEVYGPDGEPLVDDEPFQAQREAAFTPRSDEDLDRIFDPERPSSRAEFLRGLLRRE